jgi:hypothetical protein
MQRRTLSAIAGASIFAGASYVFVAGLTPRGAPSTISGSAVLDSLTISEFSAPGKLGRTRVETKTIEEWSWSAPERVVVGESAQIALRCRIKIERTTKTGPVDAEEETVRDDSPRSVAEPVSVTVEGTFWDKPAVQTTGANHPNLNRSPKRVRHEAR